MSPVVVRNKAIEIAMGTYMYEWEGTALDAYNRLLIEDVDSFDEIDYATPWEPFEDFSITDLFNNMSNLVDDIVNNFT